MTSGHFKVERALTRQSFETAVDSAARGKRSPLSVSMLCDCFYLFVSGDMRRFVVEAAIACETVLTEHARHYAASLGVTNGQIHKELDKPKFDQRLGKGCKMIFGRSFAEDQPDSAAWLEALWIGRNNVAHGKPLVVRHGGRSIAPGHLEFISMSDAVISLFRWMSDFGTFQPV